MTIDMTNNRVPYGLLTEEEKAALHEHKKAGGAFEIHAGTSWWPVGNTPWHHKLILRTIPLPKTQDVIAWEKLPDWVEWVARNNSGEVWAYDAERFYSYNGRRIRIDDFPGIVQIGTCDWKESKMRRPK
jgi:hypothetical protein